MIVLTPLTCPDDVVSAADGLGRGGSGDRGSTVSATKFVLRDPPRAIDGEREVQGADRWPTRWTQVANVISSNPVVGSTRHELTDLGKEQALAAGGMLWDELQARDYDVGDCVLYSSNFTRARETNELVAFEVQRLRQAATKVFDGPPVRVGLLEALRERDFGELDGANTGAYDVVWPRDLKDPTATADGVESVASVCIRLRAMIDLLEERHEGAVVGVCSHADVLQIFQCWMAGIDVGTFSSYRFRNGEVRLCDALGSHLPAPVPMVSQAASAA